MVEWIPMEQVHPRIRRQFGEREPGTVMKSCNGFVFFGDNSPGLPCGVPHSTCDIVLADGPAEYYDNRLGVKVQSCNFWYCGKHQKQCRENCPPRQWTCR